MDLVRELRLRQWARQHYVPAEERSKGWHPVVLQEMNLRDRELTPELFLDVPLAEISATVEADVVQAESASEVIVEKRVEIDFCQQPWGWTYAPLEPGRHATLHEGSSEIPRPHARKFFGESAERHEESYLFVMD